MKNSKLEQIRKSAGVTATVLNVIRTILIVGLVMAVVAGISVMCLRIENEGKTIDVFGKKITVHNMVSVGDLSVEGFDFLDMFHIEDPFLLAGVNCFIAAILIALVLVAVTVMRRTFISISKSDTPFKSEILRSIMITGILVTVIVLFSSIGIAAVVGLAFWCIYTIFDYGIELQTDVDETL